MKGSEWKFYIAYGLITILAIGLPFLLNETFLKTEFIKNSKITSGGIDWTVFLIFVIFSSFILSYLLIKIPRMVFNFDNKNILSKNRAELSSALFIHFFLCFSLIYVLLCQIRPAVNHYGVDYLFAIPFAILLFGNTWSTKFILNRWPWKNTLFNKY